MGVDASSGVGDVCRECEVREPQVLNVGVPECFVDEGVEASAGEHGHFGVC